MQAARRHHRVDTMVERLIRDLARGEELVVEHDRGVRQRADGRFKPREEAVIVAAALSEPPPVAVDRGCREEDSRKGRPQGRARQQCVNVESGTHGLLERGIPTPLVADVRPPLDPGKLPFGLADGQDHVEPLPVQFGEQAERGRLRCHP
jgi:hypothetical protein